jgi:hypothetical protein
MFTNDDTCPAETLERYEGVGEVRILVKEEGANVGCEELGREDVWGYFGEVC